MGSRGSNRREKYFFTLKYNNIVDVIEIYKDIRGRNKVKIEL